MPTIIIPFFNGHRHIGRLLDSLPVNLPVIVVDDHSDLILSIEAGGRPIQVIRPEAKGYFTGAVNRGIEACDSDVLILNQDVYFTGEGWLSPMAEYQEEFDLIGESIRGKHPHWPQGYIHGTFMYISRRLIDKIGLLNEIDYPLWGSTCEYQLRACRAGFRVLPLPKIPDFVHTRQGAFGGSIRTILKREPEKTALFVDVPPKISVVTACHNYGRFLPDLVNSLIGGQTSLGKMPGQSFQSFEVVIVDDGSTDDTPEIGQGLADGRKAIRYIRRENGGSAAAINTAIRAAYGEYIAVIDADDMMESGRLETLYRLQLKHPHSFTFDETVLFGNGQRGVMHQGRKVRRMRLHEYDFEEVLKKNGVHKGIFFPKRAWEEAGGYPETMRYGREDWAFNVALGLKGWCGVKVPDYAGYLYRREGHNRTLTNTSPEWRQKFMGQMLALYPEVYRGYRPMGCCGSKAAAPKLNGGGGGSSMSKMVELPGAKDGFEIMEYIGDSAGDMSWYPNGRRYVFGGIHKVGHVDKRDVEVMLKTLDQGKPAFRVYQKPVEQPVEMVKEIEGESSPEELIAIHEQFLASPAKTLVITRKRGKEGEIITEKTTLNKESAKGSLEWLKREQENMRTWAEIKPKAPVVEIEEAPELVTVVESWTGPMVTTGKNAALPFDPSDFSVAALKKQLDNLNEEELEALLEAEQAGLNRKGAINAIGEVLNG